MSKIRGQKPGRSTVMRGLGSGRLLPSRRGGFATLARQTPDRKDAVLVALCGAICPELSDEEREQALVMLMGYLDLFRLPGELLGQTEKGRPGEGARPSTLRTVEYVTAPKGRHPPPHPVSQQLHHQPPSLQHRHLWPPGWRITWISVTRNPTGSSALGVSPPPSGCHAPGSPGQGSQLLKVLRGKRTMKGAGKGKEWSRPGSPYPPVKFNLNQGQHMRTSVGSEWFWIRGQRLRL